MYDIDPLKRYFENNGFSKTNVLDTKMQYKLYIYFIKLLKTFNNFFNNFLFLYIFRKYFERNRL